MRRYRKRKREAIELQRAGMQHVRVPLHVTEVDALIQMRFLREQDRHDPEWLRGAVMGLIYWVLDDPELMARRRGTRSR
jgi:hypothetical protein